MNKKTQKINFKLIILKIFLCILLISILSYFFIKIVDLIKQPTDVFMVENGSLSYEEQAIGYVLRDEETLKGENYKNGMVMIKSDGERVAIHEQVFRYYSNGEESVSNKIKELDTKIEEAIGNQEDAYSGDILLINNQIEKVLNKMYKENDIQKIKESKNEIDAYISKKAEIIGENSATGSYINDLLTERNELAKSLEKNSEIIETPISGVISYRVDGYEELLEVDNFEYLNKDLLNSLEAKTGSIIPISTECGKIVNNFKCYIATSMKTEKAMEANVNDKVTLRISNGSELDAKIVYTKEEEKSKILVFEITKEVEELINYRKISFDIIWWNFEGFKISNNAIIEKDDQTYVIKNRAGYLDTILIKVLRQNDTFSIVENYTKEELEQKGFNSNEIKNMVSINLYDEILLNPTIQQWNFKISSD